ncbi:MAG: coproporphyrinogen dehydrogenase HemZ [Clostridia bacterium]
MILETTCPFQDDIFDEIRLFLPSAEINENEDLRIIHNYSFKNQIIINEIEIIDKTTTKFASKQEMNVFCSELEEKKLLKREVKLAFYNALSEHFNEIKPWGCLTGIRPTRLAYEFLLQGHDINDIKKYFTDTFLVREDKAELVKSVVENQVGIVRGDNLINLYINIPFCPTRCSYCSFVAFDMKNNEELLREYLANLIKELIETKKLIKEKQYKINSIYIGGGTPTTLSAKMLDELLTNIDFEVKEFTVECGRPDTITKEKFDVLKKHNVTRICINPQTFKDETLLLIGRKHTGADTLKAYELAQNYNFSINMDLIAGLPNENFADFESTLDKTILLNPSSITVHTLSIKNGSFLANKVIVDDASIEKMVDFARNKLEKNGYYPYYLYRQKHQLSCQENVGYCKKGKTCRFNIESMEETNTILACGAGGITKRVFNNENRIERCANLKNVQLYIKNIDEVIMKKFNFFNNGQKGETNEND